jgi:hypothetical protein
MSFMLFLVSSCFNWISNKTKGGTFESKQWIGFQVATLHPYVIILCMAIIVTLYNRLQLVCDLMSTFLMLHFCYIWENVFFVSMEHKDEQFHCYHFFGMHLAAILKLKMVILKHYCWAIISMSDHITTSQVML